MKITKTGILALITLAFSLFVVAQNARAQEVQRTRSKAVYLEVLGNGLTYSLNFDARFSKSLKGLGGRAGIGYMAVDGDNLTSIPIIVNYLFGKDKHYFEVGAGTAFLAASTPTQFGSIDTREKGSAFIGTMSFGYRLEPQNGGFMFRAGITPLFDGTSFFPFWPQVSFGYSF